MTYLREQWEKFDRHLERRGVSAEKRDACKAMFVAGALACHSAFMQAKILELEADLRHEGEVKALDVVNVELRALANETVPFQANVIH